MKVWYIRTYRLVHLERALSVAVVVLGCWLKLYLSRTAWAQNSASPLNNPAFFPGLVSSAALVLGAALLLSSFFWTDREKTATVNLLGLVVLGMFTLYVAAWSLLGFVLSSILVLMGSMVLWGVRSKRLILILSVAIPTVIYFVFSYFLGIRFPTLFL